MVAIISKFTFKITTQAEHKLFVLPVYQFFQFMPLNFSDALSSNIGLWLVPNKVCNFGLTLFEADLALGEFIIMTVRKFFDW